MEFAMPLNANEQYLLELINRARLDPGAELARYNAAVASGVYGGAKLASLNAGLTAGTISNAAIQPLAANESLNNAAAAHSLHMLAVDKFDHSGIGDGDLGSRADSAGYNWTMLGENISWSGTTGTVNERQAIENHQFGLFRSDYHRENLHNASFSAGGIGAEIGQYSIDGGTYNASMLTEMFGDNGSQYFLTGVVYNDANANRFYTPGEGYSAAINVNGAGATNSSAAGGYSMIAANGTHQVTLGGVIVSVVFAGQNVKLDLLNGNQIQSSVSVTAVSGVGSLELLGNANLSATGASKAETIIGNAGNNTLNGMAGADTIYGKAGADILNGGTGNDTLDGGKGNDLFTGGTGADKYVFMSGSGDDTISHFSSADFIALDTRLATSFSTAMSHADQVGLDVVFTFDGDSLTLANTALSSLNAGDFNFV
jgi:uncharacterized protein YkwD